MMLMLSMMVKMRLMVVVAMSTTCGVAGYVMWCDSDDDGHVAISVAITVKISHALAMARVLVLVAVAIVGYMTLTLWWQISYSDMLMNMRCSVYGASMLALMLLSMMVMLPMTSVMVVMALAWRRRSWCHGDGDYYEGGRASNEGWTP
jgi:hypothetical protein